MGVMSALQTIDKLQFELHHKKLFMDQVREWHKPPGFNSPLEFLKVGSHINILSLDLRNCGAVDEKGNKLAGLIQFLENGSPR